MRWHLFFAVVMAGIAAPAMGQGKLQELDPYSLVEGPMPAAPLAAAGQGPQPGAVILPSVPADYDWWNGCSPTAGGMLFGWWEEAGVDAFPGGHRNLPATYPNTSSNPADYLDARGVVAGWAHKQAGAAKGLSYGDYAGHAPDSLADFILTSNASTSRGSMAWGFQTFGAWDDPRTAAVESRRFAASTAYVLSGWTFADYCDQIDAGRPVHLGLSSDGGGHSVLGVGYNTTDGRQDVVLQTTWHWGLQEWQWANETHSGHQFSVYGGTKLTAPADPAPQLSAYFSLAHTYVGDLTVVLGTGDPNAPAWSTTVWSGPGSADNLVFTDIDCTAQLEAFGAGMLDWFVKVTDDRTGDTGSIEDFQIRWGFDEQVFGYDGGPVPIIDNQSVAVHITTPEPSTLCLLVLGGWLGICRRRRAER